MGVRDHKPCKDLSAEGGVSAWIQPGSVPPAGPQGLLILTLSVQALNARTNIVDSGDRVDSRNRGTKH